MAQHDGGVRLVFQPNGGEAVEITVGVVAKIRDEDIGDDIAKELKLVTGSRYELKAKGEEVRIRKASKEVPFFTVYVTHWNVMGVGIRVDGR